MRPKNCRVKQIDANLKLAIGSLTDIAKTDDGRAIIVENLHFLPVPRPEDISVSNSVTDVQATLLEMCLRRALMIRDTMGNVQDDFYGWNYVQYRALNFLKGDFAEDLINKAWYGLEKMLAQVFITFPYYALRQIHYSTVTREIVFVGDFKNATNEYVEFVRYAGTDSIVNCALRYTRSNW